MSRLTVGSIEGLTENSNVISVPTGHSLNVADAGGLQIGGSAVVSAGLVHVSRTTIGTAVSSVAISNCFSADYDSYLMIIQGGVASTSNVLQAVIGGTATGYYYAGWYSVFGSNSLVAQRGYNTTQFPVGKGEVVSLNGRAIINSPFLSKYTTYISEYEAITGGGDSSYIAGFGPDDTSDTDITITTNTGTITGGTIDLYGYAKA